jgi:hemoglobin-like flavoprotein
MTPHQKMLVQTTFAKVAPIADTAAALFYAKLFELDPSLRSMFKSDMREQGRKLMQMLAVAVRGLDDLDALVPIVQGLGRRHVRYGVQDEHYETVGEALIWTLGIGLHEGFTAEVREAWAAAYGLLADTMKAGAAEPLVSSA